MTIALSIFAIAYAVTMAVTLTAYLREGEKLVVWKFATVGLLVPLFLWICGVGLMLQYIVRGIGYIAGLACGIFYTGFEAGARKSEELST